MKKLNNTGFSVVEVVLLIVIVGVIAGVGFYVYKANKNTNESLNNTGNSDQSALNSKNSNTNDESDSQSNQSADVNKDITTSITIVEFNAACQSGAGLRACGSFTFKKDLALSDLQLRYGTNSGNLDQTESVFLKTADDQGFAVYDVRIPYTKLSQGTKYFYKVTGSQGSASHESNLGSFTAE